MFYQEDSKEKARGWGYDISEWLQKTEQKILDFVKEVEEEIFVISEENTTDKNRNS